MKRKYILVMLLISLIPVVALLSGCEPIVKDPTTISATNDVVVVTNCPKPVYSFEEKDGDSIDAGDPRHSIEEQWRSYGDKVDKKNVNLGYDGMDLRKNNIVEYGNGIYYFKAIRANFGNMLSHFIQDHTNLEVITITPDVVRRNSRYNIELCGSASTRDYSATVGYFVIFREKELK